VHAAPPSWGQHPQTFTKADQNRTHPAGQISDLFRDRHTRALAGRKIEEPDHVRRECEVFSDLLEIAKRNDDFKKNYGTIRRISLSSLCKRSSPPVPFWNDSFCTAVTAR